VSVPLADARHIGALSVGAAVGALRVGAVLLAAVLVAGCGSTPAKTSASSRAAVAGLSVPTLATSASSLSGTGWAIVSMGGPASAFDNFWELFVRPAGGTNWKLATPGGVASNGGLVMAATGPTSLVTGFRPSQKLTFSPLAATADAGAQWSQTALLSPGFGDVPDALGGGYGGKLIALTDTGDVETSTNLGATWAKITTQRSLAGLLAGRACGVQALTAAAWTPGASPLVAASCGKPGVAGIFAFSAGAWHLSGPPLPAALSHDTVNVVSLATTGQRTTAVLAARSAARTTLLAAWSADGGATWRLSPGLAAGIVGKSSVSIWADGSVGLVLPASTVPASTVPASTVSAGTGTSGVTIGWQSATWRTLPPLPPLPATLASGADGEPQALAVSPSMMTAWQLAAGSSRWTLAQTLQVTVPYGRLAERTP
jgi:hypothetical protein